MCAISQFSFARRSLEYVGQEERCIVGGVNVQNRSGVVEQQGMSLFHAQINCALVTAGVRVYPCIDTVPQQCIGLTRHIDMVPQWCSWCIG